MTLHVGSDNITDIRKGSTKIAKVYHGSDLVWGYTPGEVLFDSSSSGPGTYPLYVKCRCKLNIQVVGAGGGGSYNTQSDGSNFFIRYAAGGQGAYIYGTMEVSPGNYTIIVGAGGAGRRTLNASGKATDGESSSAFGQIAGGGGGAYAGDFWTWGPVGTGGSASTTLSFIDGEPGKTTPIYSTYGAGGAEDGNTPGGDGYVKIVAV